VETAAYDIKKVVRQIIMDQKKVIDLTEKLIQKIIGMQHNCNAVHKQIKTITYSIGMLDDICKECKKQRDEIEKTYKELIDGI